MRSNALLYYTLISLFFIGINKNLEARDTNEKGQKPLIEIPTTSEPGAIPPAAIEQPMPSYTEEAKVSSIEGTVVLQVNIDQKGAIRNVTLTKGVGYGLDESAIHTVTTKWHFNPGMVNGIPAAMTTTISISFRLLSLTDAERSIINDYPLRVFLAGTNWSRKPFGISGSGNLNVLDGESFQGFEYRTSCRSMFKPFNGDRAALGKWVEPDAKLEIVLPKIGKPQKLDKCELNTALVNYVYVPKTGGGGLTSLTMEQWKELRSTTLALQNAIHPTDINAAHYPLKVELLEMNWTPYESYGLAVRGYSSIGHGNILTRDATTGFDFSAVCPSPLQVSMPGTWYQGRWSLEGSKLQVMSVRIGDRQDLQTCEFKTSLIPGASYVKNRITGALNLTKQNEYRNTTSKQETLSNSDVIEMVESGVSVEIILAKISASDCTFNTSAEGLRGLKNAKVPDKIVIEMVKHPNSN
jgi:TonB family protein